MVLVAQTPDADDFVYTCGGSLGYDLPVGVANDKCDETFSGGDLLYVVGPRYFESFVYVIDRLV